MTSPEHEALQARVAQHPPDRYPAQHATAQFHLGALLLRTGDSASALAALRAAREVFGRTGMRVEHAKAGLMLGIALREAGLPDESETAFVTAVGELAALDQPAEQAAAAYNLGLVQHGLGRTAEAHRAWTQAREIFLSAGHPGQAAAAARDHGGALLAGDDPEAAVPLLEQAVRLAEMAGDLSGVGAAANALGLARLSLGRPDEAAQALRAAVGAFPRSVRPAEHAMAKANLALAYAESGARSRSRLAALQALAVVQSDAAVRVLAGQLLERLPGDATYDLQEVLAASPPEQWVGVLREEVLRACELTTPAREQLLRGILDGLLARHGQAYDQAESLLHVVVELPPRAYAQVVAALVAGTADRPRDQTDRLHAVVGSAMARFAIPQWQRLAAALNDAAQAAGHPPVWR